MAVIITNLPPQSPDTKSAEAHDLPAVLVQRHPGQWQSLGSGLLTWSVFKLYRATLFARGSFDPCQPFALDLAYLRTISSLQIIDVTMTEIERMGFGDASQREDWGQQLARIVPDVKLGDHLVGLFLPDQGVEFFSTTHDLGQLMSPEFSRAFAAIWLDPQTRSPELRAALLGGKQ